MPTPRCHREEERKKIEIRESHWKRRGGKKRGMRGEIEKKNKKQLTACNAV